MTYHQHSWAHPETPSPAGGAPRGDVAHRHELVVDEDDWDVVRHKLHAADITPVSDPITSFGLVRVELPVTYDSISAQDGLIDALEQELGRRPRLGRNRLVARSVLAFDDQDAQSTPKVMPSAFAPAVPAGGTTLERSGVATAPGACVRVGVVDSALTRHSFLEGGCVYRPVPLEHLLHEEAAGEVTGHATFIAALIRQLAPAAVVQVENVISPAGLGDLVDVHDAICRLSHAGAQLVNLSLGCTTADDELPFVLDHALGYATARARHLGLEAPIFVASAGNQGGTRKFWPAADPRVWAVAGAARIDGAEWTLADYSGHGEWVDVAAPSDDVLSARPLLTVGAADWNANAYWSGTSFAAAIATGLLARRIATTSTGSSSGLAPGEKSAAEVFDTGSSIVADQRQLALCGTGDVVVRPGS